MEFKLNDAISMLERTPAVVRTLIQGLSPEWTGANEGENTWSPFDVLGHLIHGEKTDWIPRAKIILEAGDTRAFDPFDRFAQFEESKGKQLEELLDTFQTLRAQNIAVLKSFKLVPQDLEKQGLHPELGRVTLGQLLATWVAHDLDHVIQISRTIAKQYRDAVGPWRAYIAAVR